MIVTSDTRSVEVVKTVTEHVLRDRVVIDLSEREANQLRNVLKGLLTGYTFHVDQVKNTRNSYGYRETAQSLFDALNDAEYGNKHSDIIDSNDYR